MRVFVAFDLAIKVVEKLVLLQEDLNRPITNLGAKPRWTEAPNIHLTLKFIGETSDAMALRMREQLAAVAERHPIFEVATVGTGCFPDCARPRIVWAGTRGGAEAICALQANVEEVLEELGIPKETREFHPHVTLGRIKTRKSRLDIGPLIAPYRDTNFGLSQVKDMALFKSTLHPKGAVYTVLERFPLLGR